MILHSRSSWLSQPNGFEFEKAVDTFVQLGLKIICQVSWRLERMCGHLEVKSHQMFWMSPGWCHEQAYTYQIWLRYIKGLLRNWPTSCLATSPSSLIACHGQTALNFNKFNIRLSCSEVHQGQVARRLDTICDKRDLLNVFYQTKHGGKSNMAEKYIIELGLAQRFHRYIVCEKRMKGSKVNNIDECPTLTCWWR